MRLWSTAASPCVLESFPSTSTPLSLMATGSRLHTQVTALQALLAGFDFAVRGDQ